MDYLLNKKDELLSRLVEIQPDIICFTEIKAKNQILIPLDSEFEIPNYDMFINKNAKRGTALYINKNLKAQEHSFAETNMFSENIWCSFKSGTGENILIGCIYRSPHSSYENTESLYRLLNANDLQKFDKICVCGDFNMPDIRWDGVWNGDKNNEFIECVRDAFLIQKVQNPTRHRAGQRSTLLDLVLVNDDKLISDITHLAPLGKSDHDILQFDLYVSKNKTNYKLKYQYNLNKGDYVNFRKFIASSTIYMVENDNTIDNVEKMWGSIKQAILDGMDKFIPKVPCKQIKKVKPLWMNNKLLRKIKKKNKLYKRYLNTKEGSDYNRYILERNLCNKLIKKFRKQYEKDIANDCKSNPKRFWKYVQNRTKHNAGINTLIRKDGSSAVSDKDKAETLNQFFSSVFTIEDRTNVPNLAKGGKSNGVYISDVRVTPEAVKNKLKNLEANKAQGPDQIPPKVLKELCNELAVPLCNLFNLSLETGQLPQDWKLAEVAAIFKKGTKSEPGNYRPVSLTSICCKVLESIIRDVLVDHFTDNNLYNECQHGFRKKRSCVTQLLKVMEELTALLDDKHCIDIVYLDFRKAFDTVPHERLLQKLESYGITGNIISWIRQFLSDRMQLVKVGNEYSDKTLVLSGIPQGSILGPLLFTVFINDLPEGVQSVCKLFADDTKIFNISSNHDILQQDLNYLLDWSNIWDLHFNVEKCKVLHVGKHNPLNSYFMLSRDGTTAIEPCSEEKDLGVTFNKHLNFDTHIHNCVNKANKMLGLIKRTFRYLDKTIFCKLYKALVRPHLEYANSIWYPYLKRQSITIEKVQRRATKLLKECRHMTYSERLSFLNLHSLLGRRIRGDLIQVFKIYNGIDDLSWSDFFLLTLVVM